MVSIAAVKSLCGGEILNPFSLVRVLDSTTDKLWLSYEPEELTRIAGISADNIFQQDFFACLQIIRTNPDCFDDWHLFHHVATVLNHRRASFEFLDAITYIEAAWCCTVLLELNPSHEFSLGVKRYISALCMNDGLLYFPWIRGDGLDLTTFYPLKGLIDNNLSSVVAKVKEAWNSGALKSVSPSDVDDEDVFHVQCAKIVNAEEYIRRCRAC